jgi:hypothetical protein
MEIGGLHIRHREAAAKGSLIMALDEQKIRDLYHSLPRVF